jgi:CubicO group peptidase (beta-lactamase class C family)
MVHCATFSARGFGGHHLVIVPSQDLVIVHRVDTYDPKRTVSDARFGHLLQLILDARRP